MPKPLRTGRGREAMCLIQCSLRLCSAPVDPCLTHPRRCSTPLQFLELRQLSLEACQTVFEGLDARSEGFMLHSELPIALRRVLGHEPTERQRKAFSAYFAGAPVCSPRYTLREAPTLPVAPSVLRADRNAVASVKHARVCDYFSSSSTRSRLPSHLLPFCRTGTLRCWTGWTPLAPWPTSWRLTWRRRTQRM
jgi:hypothetical protein